VVSLEVVARVWKKKWVSKDEGVVINGDEFTGNRTISSSVDAGLKQESDAICVQYPVDRQRIVR
jgi:hypothetical protein